jgi:stress-induced morphogen
MSVMPRTAGAISEVKVVPKMFTSKSRFERHRLVNSVPAPELAGQIHALIFSHTNSIRRHVDKILES